MSANPHLFLRTFSFLLGSTLLVDIGHLHNRVFIGGHQVADLLHSRRHTAALKGSVVAGILHNPCHIARPESKQTKEEEKKNTPEG
jgi:hypothetical protein